MREKKTRKLKLNEHRELMAFLGSRGINEAARECGVSSAVIGRMRDRRGKSRLSTIGRVFKAVREAQKKSVATQPLVPAINGWPRDFTSILASFENAGGSVQVRCARARPEDFDRFYSYHLGILAKEAGRAKDEDTRSRVLNEMLEIRADYSAYLKGKPGPEEESDSHNPLDFIEACDLNFNLGNAVKHIVMGTKVDLEKAALYLKRELGRRSS